LRVGLEENQGYKKKNEVRHKQLLIISGSLRRYASTIYGPHLFPNYIVLILLRAAIYPNTLVKFSQKTFRCILLVYIFNIMQNTNSAASL